jgi:hypothetical protein
MGITGPNKESHLRELIDPIKDEFDRIVWGFHGWDQGYEYLKSVAEVIDLKWCGRLDLSRNIVLNYAGLSHGDRVVIVDDLERIKPEFFELLDKYGDDIFSQADVFLLHGKRFMFSYSENLHFSGNPHEGLQGGQRYAELTDILPFSDSSLYFENVRPKYRKPFEWIEHYCKYYFYKNSNHILLGCEGKPELVQKRAVIRYHFLRYLDELGIEHDVDSLIGYWKSGKLNDRMREFINSEKILNDLYRFEILGERDLTDSHDYENIKEI